MKKWNWKIINKCLKLIKFGGLINKRFREHFGTKGVLWYCKIKQ